MLSAQGQQNSSFAMFLGYQRSRQSTGWSSVVTKTKERGRGKEEAWPVGSSSDWTLRLHPFWVEQTQNVLSLFLVCPSTRTAPPQPLGPPAAACFLVSLVLSLVPAGWMHLTQEVLGSCGTAHRKLLPRLLIPRGEEGWEGGWGHCSPAHADVRGPRTQRGYDFIAIHPGQHRGCPLSP